MKLGTSADGKSLGMVSDGSLAAGTSITNVDAWIQAMEAK